MGDENAAKNLVEEAKSEKLSMGSDAKLIIYIGAGFGGFIFILAIGIFIQRKIKERNHDRDYS